MFVGFVIMKIDPEKYQKGLDQLSEILSGIVRHADEQTLVRCPYKSQDNECTSKFGCRYKRKPAPDRALFQCVSDDKLDYRSAWDSNPKLHEKALRDIAKIKSTDKS